MANTLQVRNFPIEVNKALKKMAVDQGISFRALVIQVLTKAATQQTEPPK